MQRLKDIVFGRSSSFLRFWDVIICTLNSVCWIRHPQWARFPETNTITCKHMNTKKLCLESSLRWYYSKWASMCITILKILELHSLKPGNRWRWAELKGNVVENIPLLISAAQPSTHEHISIVLISKCAFQKFVAWTQFLRLIGAHNTVYDRWA